MPIIDRVAHHLWARGVKRPERVPGLRDPAASGRELAAPRNAHPRPSGLGMFVGGFRACGSPGAFGARLRATGIRWVAPLVLWQYRDRPDRRWNADSAADHALAYLEAARSAGVTVWPWAWPVPGREAACIEELVGRAVAWQSPGVILDPEHAWKGRAAAAATLMDLAIRRTSAEGMTLGVTSYGAPWWHRTMPWAELARAGWGVPQVYDGRNTLGPGYPARGVAAWQDLGFAEVVPAFATYGKSSGQLRAHLASMPQSAAAIGWQWRTTSSSEWPIIKEFGHRFSLHKEFTS